MHRTLLLTAFTTLLLAGCAPDAAPSGTGENVSDTGKSSSQAAGKALGTNGIGELRIGRGVPVGGLWTERSSPVGGGCVTATSLRYPGVYAIVEGGKVRRITLGPSSLVPLSEGIAVGAAETEVRARFSNLREEPHKYEAQPAKYLVVLDPASGEPVLRFEIGTDGNVKLIHRGEMPALAYVEGCG